MKSLIGKKLGMTQIFGEDGKMTPVTVIEAGPCTVMQRKTVEADGYEAIQIGYGSQKESRVTKPLLGHFKKAEAAPARVLGEIRIAGDEEVKVGDTLNAADFSEIKYIDVIGRTKGRGFQGVVKRYGFAGGRASHGGGWTRRTGSIGQCEFPARVFKGKKMPGQMGTNRITTQNLKVVQVREDENLILVKGAVPGANGSVVMIREALKRK